MPKVQKKIGGFITALITPFDVRGRVNDDALSGLVSFQISKGAEGLFACGSTGLGPMLRVEERKRVVDVVVEEASGRVPVVVQVGSADTSTSVELAKHAEKTGADAVASLTPYYYKPGENAISKHFETISESVDLPLFAYSIPQFTGNNLMPRTVAAMAKRRTIAGIKDSSRDFLQLAEMLNAVPEDFIVMNGTEEYALFAMMLGADGVVSGGANAYPEVFKELVVCHRARQYASALAAQQTILKFKDAVRAGPIPSYYEILHLRGIECGEPRAPFLPLDKPSKTRLSAEMRRLSVL